MTFVMYVQQLLIGAVRGVAAAYVSDLELRIQILLPALAVWPQVLVRQAGARLAAPSCCGCILWDLCGAIRAPLCISTRPRHVCQLVPFCSRLYHFRTRHVSAYPTAHSLGIPDCRSHFFWPASLQSNGVAGSGLEANDLRGSDTYGRTARFDRASTACGGWGGGQGDGAGVLKRRLAQGQDAAKAPEPQRARSEDGLLLNEQAAH